MALLGASPADAQAVLRIDTTPARAYVQLDGVRVGRAPLVLPVEPGTRRLRTGLVGYAADERTVEVAAGDTLDLQITLADRRTRIRIEGLPPAARVTINGAHAPGGELTTESGPTTIRVDIEGRRPLTVETEVAPGEQRVLTYGTAVRPSAVPAFSLLAPGAVQAADGRPFVGAVFLAGAVGSVGAAYSLRFKSRQTIGERERALELYSTAPTEQQAVLLRDLATDATGRYRRQVRQSELWLGVAGLIYASSLVDAFVHHRRRPGLAAAAAPRVSLAPTPTGATVRVSL